MYFTIIVPFYNTPLKMIDSLISQLESLNNDYFEIIFVNDGSDEKTSLFVKEKAKHFKYIAYYPNRGVSHARNIGIKKAKGEYLLFIDSDDLVNIELLKTLPNMKLKDLSIFISDIFYTSITEANNNIKEIRIGKSLDEMYASCGIKGIALRSACGKIFKKKILIDNELCFDENLPFYEDAMFVSKYYSFVKDFSVYSNILYHYRMNQNSSSKRFNRCYIEKYVIFFEKYKNEFKRNINFILGLYYDAFNSVLVSKVTNAFKHGHYFYATQICDNKNIVEATQYLYVNGLLDTKYAIKLASLIINGHNILATNKIIIHQVFGSLKIRIGRLFKRCHEKG